MKCVLYFIQAKACNVTLQRKQWQESSTEQKRRETVLNYVP